jgi:hypothetical protein
MVHSIRLRITRVATGKLVAGEASRLEDSCWLVSALPFTQDVYGIAKFDINASGALCSDAMRTTLTLDDDVAAMLRRAQQLRKVGLKQLVNEGLREGLARMMAPETRRKPYRVKPMDLGRCRLAALDNIAEALVLSEGEGFR